MSWDYFKYVNAVLSPDSGLAPSPRLVAVAMARRGEFFFESHATLAGRTGLSRRTVWQSIKDLESSGWIKRGDEQRQTVVWVLATIAQTYATIAQDVATVAQVEDEPTFANTAQGYATIAQGYANSANLPTQPLHTKDLRERTLKDLPKEGKPWAPPSWFIPLTTLTGYKKINHDKAVERIEKTCAQAGVAVGVMVASFAGEYEGLKFSYGWNDPVAVLKGKPLAIAISNAKKGRPNGSPASNLNQFGFDTITGLNADGLNKYEAEAKRLEGVQS
jgi:hypothetical protein